MTRKPNSSLTPAGLRRRAEARLRQRRDRQKSRTQETRSTADTRRLPHELQVHQVELEMQNAELQEARNQIEAQLEKYTDLYDFAPVGYCSLDEQGRILEVNLTGAALLGVERSRLTHQRLPRFVAPVSQPLFLAFLKKLFAGPDAQACEALLLKERVGTFWAGFRGTSAVSVGATRKSSRISFVDITARKQGEEALRASEERFRALFELGPVAVYSCDAAGTIQDFNRRAAELWGREPAFGDTDERFCGSFKLFRPDGNPLPHGQCPMAQVLDGKIAEVRDAEVLIERPDGSRVSVVVNIRPLGYKLGKITGAINCFFDITERKRAESAHRR
ncbi:MAG TPA: PAS domain S-box protein, partial [Candidatus Binatia bacterium]|nr:PAS domain S-box protein [Candidatus Binatia bacterium]